MRAFDSEVVDAVWAAVEALIPVPAVDEHPLGCHRPRVPDRVCFQGILIRLVTGCAWVDVERLLGNQVSDTTLRDRRDEWIAAGVFEHLADEAVAGYDRVIGLDFSECSVDGSQHKAPAGGEGTGPSPVDRGKRAGSGRCSRIVTASPSPG
jgi:transposase